MTRLIDADELNEYIGRESLDTREKIFALVDRMPTIEPRPHGEWIETFFTTGCSICKEEFRVSGEWAKAHFNFCPNCGADMRGEAE